MDSLLDLLPVILVFVIFSLPEILKGRRKNNKKYEYPELPTEVMTEPAREIFIEPVEEIVGSHTPINVARKEATVAKKKKQPAITAARAVDGLVLGEILGKPRAYNPIPRVGLYRGRK